jgi:biopolymer transport protein ExbB/biopolymer transport protein TolQ
MQQGVQVSFSLFEVFKRLTIPGYFVAATLLIMSIWSVNVAIDRWLAYRRARMQSLKAMNEAYERLEEGQMEEALAATRKYPGGNLARIMGAALASALTDRRRGEPVDIESAERAIEKERGQIVSGMKKGMTVLATVSATAPFVGLFGTVIGIIAAFAVMGKTGQGGLGQVAGGISEALVMTAFGLVVAIPAVWIYNYFNGRVDELHTDIDTIKAEIIDFLARPEKGHAASKPAARA